MPEAQVSSLAQVSRSGEYLARLSNLLTTLDNDAVDEGIAMIQRAWDEGRQIITLGNGGSAMTALHFITDWNKAGYLAKRRPFRGRSLVDNVGLMTAYSNDMSYDRVFSEQLMNIAVPGDLVIAVSGSGNSPNVIRAVAYANEIGCPTLGLCGFSGGELKRIASHGVWAPVQDMQLCEDVHAIFGHIVMKALVS